MNDNKAIWRANESILQKYASTILKTHNIENNLWDDAFQELMLAAWNSIEKWDAELGKPFKSYAYTAMSFKCRDVLKLYVARIERERKILAMIQNNYTLEV